VILEFLFIVMSHGIRIALVICLNKSGMKIRLRMKLTYVLFFHMVAKKCRIIYS